MSRSDILTMFREKLLDFLSNLIVKFPSEGDFVLLKIFVSEFNTEQLLKVFTERIMPYIDMIKSKDERFFLQSTDLFEGIANEKVSYFRNIWTSPSLSQDDKDNLWAWFRLFSNLAVKYNDLTN